MRLNGSLGLLRHDYASFKVTECVTQIITVVPIHGSIVVRWPSARLDRGPAVRANEPIDNRWLSSHIPCDPIYQIAKVSNPDFITPMQMDGSMNDPALFSFPAAEAGNPSCRSCYKSKIADSRHLFPAKGDPPRGRGSRMQAESRRVLICPSRAWGEFK